MLTLPQGIKVFVYTESTDMRRQLNGLAVLVREAFGREPQGGDLFVFRGRRGDMSKVLFHDGQGMCMLVKRLDRGVFVFAPHGQALPKSMEITAKQLAAFLSGMSLAQKDTSAT